jgi:hypothetical protein
VRDVVVLGHGHFGGIETLLSGSNTGEFLDPWLGIIKPSCLGKDIDRSQAERQVVRLSLANLRTFPWIEALVEQGSLGHQSSPPRLMQGSHRVITADRASRASQRSSSRIVSAIGVLRSSCTRARREILKHLEGRRSGGEASPWQRHGIRP